MKSAKPILYAEDDENDAFLMERAFEIADIRNPLRVVTDGKMAVAYLAGQPPFTNREENPLPLLMLLDLSMPKLHGLEVLQWVKSQQELSSLPILVLSSSNQESDVERAYHLGAKGYLMKPGDPDELIRMVKSIQQYWLSEAKPAGDFLDFGAAGIIKPSAF
jgi:CheY-like chemotaxis protein